MHRITPGFAMRCYAAASQVRQACLAMRGSALSEPVWFVGRRGRRARALCLACGSLRRHVRLALGARVTVLHGASCHCRCCRPSAMLIGYGCHVHCKPCSHWECMPSAVLGAPVLFSKQQPKIDRQCMFCSACWRSCKGQAKLCMRRPCRLPARPYHRVTLIGVRPACCKRHMARFQLNQPRVQRHAPWPSERA